MWMPCRPSSKSRGPRSSISGEYYDDYYAVFFLDPDGMKFEGMKWGERHAKAARARLKRKAKKK